MVSDGIANKSTEIVCLNCGTVCHDKFCPHCGQSTGVPPRLRMKNFGKGVLMSFGRLTPGFFTTAKGLMLHPWDVIRNHIHGRHILYSPPITMLIQVYLYAAILYALVDGIFGTDIVKATDVDVNIVGYEGSNQMLKLIDSSLVLGTFMWGVPMCLCIYLGFYWHGARKFNFAEYLAAFFYMFAAISIYDFIFNLATVIPGVDFDVTYLTWIVCGIFSIVVLVKAFPQNRWWKYPILFLWSGFIIAFFFNVMTRIIFRLTGYNILAD